MQPFSNSPAGIRFSGKLAPNFGPEFERKRQDKPLALREAAGYWSPIDLHSIFVWVEALLAMKFCETARMRPPCMELLTRIRGLVPPNIWRWLRRVICLTPGTYRATAGATRQRRQG